MSDPSDPPRPADPAPDGPAAGSGTAAPPPPDAAADDGPPPQEVEGGGAARWRLHRSIRDRKVKGVAGGVAAAADVDPTLIRLLFAVAALSGWGIVAYIVLAVVLQDETVEDPARPLPKDQRRMVRIGLLVAAIFAVGRLFDGWFFPGGGIGLPGLLIAVGAAVLWARRDQAPVGPGSPAAPLPTAPPGGGGDGDWPDPAVWPSAAAPPLGASIDWRSTGHDLLRLAAAFVAVGAALALVAGTALVVLGAVPMRVPFLPGAVGVAGLLGLVVAVVRRTRPAALFLSGGVLVVAAALAVGLSSFPGGAGNRLVVIGPGTALSERYDHSAGRLVLDLRDLTLEPGTTRRVVAKVGTGQLEVMVPRALTTGVEARVGAGNTTLFGRNQSGAGVDVTGDHAGLEDQGRLDLDLDVGVGQISVEVVPDQTFEVACTVPNEAIGDGTDAVTCPHPARLSATPMVCSVALVNPSAGAPAGQAYCRREGNVVPKAGVFAATCTVPRDSDQAECAPFSEPLHSQLQSLRDEARRDASPTTTASTVPAGGTRPAGTAPDPGPLTCGPPDAGGVLTCTPTPFSTTTTVAATYRCTPEPATGRLSCVPG
jgi:phage shock protein PspC (stress-responsive transcriptional regulator)